MRIFADHCVPLFIIESLRAEGHQVTRAVEYRLHLSPDEDIFDFAKKSKLVLLTTDRDFLNIKRFNIQKSWGVIVVTLQHTTKNGLIRLPVEFFRSATRISLKGKLFVLSILGAKRWPPKS